MKKTQTKQIMDLIIFDIDGTLTDTKKVDDNSFIQAFEETFGLDISQQNWEEIEHVTDWGITEQILLEKTGKIAKTVDYENMKSHFLRRLKEERDRDVSQFSAVKGAVSFFNKLNNNKNVCLGIATGAWEESARIKLDAIGINPDGIPFSNSNFHKTREGITKHTITQAEEKYGVSFEKIIYFGDGLWDYKTCKNQNIPFIGIDILQNGRLKALGAKHVFSDFIKEEEILGVLNVQ